MLLSSTQALVFISYDYDYIIIGGGTAGLILAARLSANPAIVVGVLEAGEWQNDNPIVYIPGLHRASIGTPLDWNFTTVPQTHVNNRVISHPLGKMLGGSSGLNFMNWCVASRGEYDWGLGWNWDAISDGWKKAEGVYPPVLQTQIDLLPKPYVNTRFHGHDGPVGMSFARWFPSSTSAILPSLRKLGVKENPDPMGGDNTGGYYCLSSIDGANVTRSTSATAFLEPNLERKNLIVLTGVTVSRIVFNNKVASGVEFLDKSGTTHTAKLNTDPKSEVILSAGSLQSPQILELSGIGKKSVLEAAGVPLLVRNDNVGENLQDHTCKLSLDVPQHLN